MLREVAASSRALMDTATSLRFAQYDRVFRLHAWRWVENYRSGDHWSPPDEST